MLTRDNRFLDSNKYFKVDAIIEFAFEKGVQYLEDQSHVSNSEASFLYFYFPVLHKAIRHQLLN